MRYSASEKTEIIQLVEHSHLPLQRTLQQLGISRSTWYNWYDRYLEDGIDGLKDRKPIAKSVWNKIPASVKGKIITLALKETEMSPRELAITFTETQGYYISEASAYRILKAEGLITSPAFILMKAADKFDPDRGVRFSTYAIWWIKASIQDYVMRNWSMVRTGSTSSQKSLFFNLRRVQARLERESEAVGEKLDKHQLRQMISTEIGVPIHDVEMMEGRLSGSDYSLNATQTTEDEGREWIEALEDDSAQAAETVEHSHDTEQLRSWLLSAMNALNERERFIVRERKLRDEPRTLESLGQELSLSKERVRQLEAAAFTKMRKSLENQSREVHHFLA